jgi:HEAT repeat protein
MTTATTVAELIAALNDRSPAVRKRTAETLGELEEVQAVEPLTRALMDSDTNVRVHAALALGMIGDMSATAPLTYALKDEEDDAVRGALETALDMVKQKVMSKKMRIF